MTESDRSPSPNPAVFVSYAREDGAAAQRIAEALRTFGIEVWFDQSELRGGDTWEKAIRNQIKTCTLFLPVVSRQTEARSEGYFRREWKLAAERTHDMGGNRAFIVPVVIDDTREAQADVPEEFLRYQWTRLPVGAPTPEFVVQVKRLLDPPKQRPALPGATTAPLLPPVTSAVEAKRPRWITLVVVGSLALGLAGIGAALWPNRPAEPVAPDRSRTRRLSIPMPPEVAIITTQVPTLAISRDGSLLAYHTNRGLETRAIDSFESRLIVPKDTRAPFFSPDGRWIGYTTETEIWKVPADGSGDPIRIAASGTHHVTWGDDGMLYYTKDGNLGIGAMAPDGTHLKQITTPDPAQKKPFHMSPEYLPGGILLYTATPDGGWGEQATLMARNLATNEPSRVVMEGASSARFVAPDHLVYLDATGNVVTRTFDPRTATVSGEPVVLAQIRSTHWSAVAHVAASREGTIVYVPGTERGKHVLVERDEAGNLRRRLYTGTAFMPAVSPVRPLLAFTESDGRSLQILTLDLSAPNPSAVKVTFGEATSDTPIWAPDGTRLLLTRQIGGTGRDVIIHTLGSGKETKLFADNIMIFPWGWSPDERWVVYGQMDHGQWSLWMKDVIDGGPPRLIQDRTQWADLSRDGRWLAYAANEAEGPRLYVVSFPDLTSKHQVVPGPATVPRFSADGLSLYYVDRDEFEKMGNLHVAQRASNQATTWTEQKTLFPAFAELYAVTQNPTRFIMPEVDETKLAREIRVITGWRGDGSRGR